MKTLSRQYESAALCGTAARACQVWAVIDPDGPSKLELPAWPRAAAREAAIRIKCALAAYEVVLPVGTVRIHADGIPADMLPACDFTGLDLPAALAVADLCGLSHTGAAHGDIVWAGMSIDGHLQAPRGGFCLGRLRAAPRAFVAPESAEEVAMSGLPAHTWADIGAALSGDAGGPVLPSRLVPVTQADEPDLSDLRALPGPLAAALARAATKPDAPARLLFSGPVGGGKTMLARRAGSLLPRLHNDRAAQVAEVRSVAGLGVAGAVRRPFRAPHFSVTPAGILGGGTGVPRPGEISLAHAGVLFLDDVEEFDPAALESLRYATATGRVCLNRATCTVVYPSLPRIIIGATSAERGSVAWDRAVAALEWDEVLHVDLG